MLWQFLYANWKGTCKSLQARWSLSCTATAFSISLEIYLRLETRRKFAKTLWSAEGFFNNGRSMAHFKSSGISPVANDKLMILVSIGNKAWQHLAMIEAGSGSSYQASTPVSALLLLNYFFRHTVEVTVVKCNCTCFCAPIARLFLQAHCSSDGCKMQLTLSLLWCNVWFTDFSVADPAMWCVYCHVSSYILPHHLINDHGDFKLKLACNLQEVGEDGSVCYKNLIRSTGNTERSFKAAQSWYLSYLSTYKITFKLKETRK